MAKIKLKKKNVSDTRHVKLKSQGKNPFEIHVNRPKFNVLGRKLKADRGLPGLSKAKYLKKRKETLLQEYKMKDKSNRFFDRRIGERNPAMTNEDRIMARFTAERMKVHNRKTLFNLGEDEVLTHKGRSLAEIENMDDPRSDGDDDDSKGLDANFVEEAHFGGGMLKKTDGKGRSAIIDQLIADSKARKAEKAKLKEKTLCATEKLDSEWKELMPMVASGKRTADYNSMDVHYGKRKKDEYDSLVQELRFEARGRPKDRLKTDSEIAQEEAKRLSLLEEERLRRMKGDDVSTPEEQGQSKRIQHRSADDLDDGFDLETNDGFVLIYDKEGNIVGLKKTVDSDEVDIKKTKDINRFDEESDSESEEEDDDNDSSDEGIEGPDDLSDLKVPDESAETEENDLDSDADIKEETEGILKKRKVNDGNLENSNVNICEGAVSNIVDTDGISNNYNEKKKVSFHTEVKIMKYENGQEICKTTESLEKEMKEIDGLSEKAKKELPYTFAVPSDYEALNELFLEKTLQEQMIILERMIKCNHPSLAEGNKEKLENLFKLLLCYLDEKNFPDCWQMLEPMCTHLFDLANFSPLNATTCFSEVLAQKLTEYMSKKSKYPPHNTIIFLKLVPILFPASDKRHPVTTPALIFILLLLRECHVTSRRSIATGLFLVSLLTQFVSFSKRILPEAINFLCGVVHMSTNIETNTRIQPPFQKIHKLLHLQESVSNFEGSFNLCMSDMSPRPSKIDDNFRIRSLHSSLILLIMYAQYYSNLTASWLILEPAKINVESLEPERYPIEVVTLRKELLIMLEDIHMKGFPPVEQEQKKPKPLRLYEPSIQSLYDGMRSKKNETTEHNKLLYKYKKEMKGALREIRRDRTFLASVKFKEQAENDAERVRRVKEIYSWGSQQQSELNKLERKKRRKKF